MFQNNLIFTYYLGITVLMVLSPMNYSFLDFLPSIVFIWIIFIVYYMGVHSRKRVSIGHLNSNDKFYLKTNDKSNTSLKFYYWLTLFCIVFVPIYIKFYTGRTILEVLQNFFITNSTGRESNYYYYQHYFEESNLRQLTFHKLVILTLYGVFKFLFLTSAIKILAYSQKIVLSQVLPIIIMSLLLFIIGISRGTSLESFELGTLFIFILFARTKVQTGKNRISKKSAGILFSVVMLSVFYFIYSKSLRYADQNVSVISSGSGETFYFNSHSFVNELVPNISLIIYEVSGYFLFGPYFISEVITQWYLSNGWSGLLFSVIPMSSTIFNGISLKDFICSSFVVCGPRWIPDSVTMINILGLPLFLLLVSFVGKFSKAFYSHAVEGSPVHLLALHLIVLQMFSFPIGNFVTSSSSTILTIVICLSIMILKPKFAKLLPCVTY